MKNNRAIWILLITVIVCFTAGYFGLKAVIRQNRTRAYCDQIVNPFFEGEIDFQSNAVKEGYRFYWNHSMGPAILITVTVENGQYRLKYNKAIASGSDSGPIEFNRKIIDEQEVLLTPEQIELIRKIVDDNQSWKRVHSKSSGIMLDGAGWGIEVKHNGSHNRNTQSSPDSGALYNIAICLLELSPYNTETDEFYIINND